MTVQDRIITAYANEAAQNLHRALVAEAAYADLEAELAGLKAEVKTLQSQAGGEAGVTEAGNLTHDSGVDPHEAP